MKTKWSMGENKTITSEGSKPKSYFSKGENVIDFELKVFQISDSGVGLDSVTVIVVQQIKIEDSGVGIDVVNVVTVQPVDPGNIIVEVEHLKPPRIIEVQGSPVPKIVSVDAKSKLIPKIISTQNIKHK